jgi:hypothetical protein
VSSVVKCIFRDAPKNVERDFFRLAQKEKEIAPTGLF